MAELLISGLKGETAHCFHNNQTCPLYYIALGNDIICPRTLKVILPALEGSVEEEYGKNCAKSLQRNGSVLIKKKKKGYASLLIRFLIRSVKHFKPAVIFSILEM